MFFSRVGHSSAPFIQTVFSVRTLHNNTINTTSTLTPSTQHPPPTDTSYTAMVETMTALCDSPPSTQFNICVSLVVLIVCYLKIT